MAIGVPGFVGEHKVHVIIQVAPVFGGSAGQPQVHTVVDRFIAAIEGAVDVGHGGVALVNVLRGEAEHVIVEPVSAHGLPPIAGQFVDATASIGTAGPRIGGPSIDGRKTRQHPRPVIVIKLIGKEIGAGEAVVLRPVVAIVLVGRQGKPSEAIVLGHIRRQVVMVPEQNRLSVTRHH